MGQFRKSFNIKQWQKHKHQNKKSVKVKLYDPTAFFCRARSRVWAVVYFIYELC